MPDKKIKQYNGFRKLGDIIKSKNRCYKIVYGLTPIKCNVVPIYNKMNFNDFIKHLNIPDNLKLSKSKLKHFKNERLKDRFGSNPYSDGKDIAKVNKLIINFMQERLKYLTNKIK